MTAALALCLLLQAGAASPILLKPGSPLIRTDRIAARTDSSFISIATDGVTRPGPVQIESIRPSSRNGRPVLEHRFVVSGRVRLDDTTWFDPATLAPIAHRSHGGGRVLSLDYLDGRVRGAMTDSAGTHEIDAPAENAFDPGALHPILRALTIKPGTYLIPFFNHEARAVRIDTVIVEAPDRLDTDTGPVPVWRLVIAAAGRRASYYIRQDDGVELKASVKFGTSEMTIVHRGIR